jgi:hypothetical protein
MSHIGANVIHTWRFHPIGFSVQRVELCRYDLFKEPGDKREIPATILLEVEKTIEK